MVGKHCGKRRNCSLRAISPFSRNVFEKPGLVWERVNNRKYVEVDRPFDVKKDNQCKERFGPGQLDMA